MCNDQIRFKQVLLNLIYNALKFTFKGYVKVKIENDVVDPIGSIKISVIDSGIGITKKN